MPHLADLLQAYASAEQQCPVLAKVEVVTKTCIIIKPAVIICISPPVLFFVKHPGNMNACIAIKERRIQLIEQVLAHIYEQRNGSEAIVIQPNPYSCEPCFIPKAIN